MLKVLWAGWLAPDVLYFDVAFPGVSFARFELIATPRKDAGVLLDALTSLGEHRCEALNVLANTVLIF